MQQYQAAQLPVVGANLKSDDGAQRCEQKQRRFDLLVPAWIEVADCCGVEEKEGLKEMAKKLRLMWLWLAWLWMGVRGFKIRDPLAAFLNCMRRSLWSYTQHNLHQYPSLVIEEATLPISLSTKLLPFHIGQRLPPHRICQNHSVGPQCRSGKVIKRCKFFIYLLFSYLATGVPVLMWATVLQRHYESFFIGFKV